MDLTDEQKKEMEVKLENFSKEIKKVCDEHGLDLVPVIKYTKQGIFPLLEIMKLETKIEEEAPTPLTNS